MDGLLGVAGMIITSDYGSFPQIPCVKRTSKFTQLKSPCHSGVFLDKVAIANFGQIRQRLAHC